MPVFPVISSMESSINSTADGTLISSNKIQQSGEVGRSDASPIGECGLVDNDSGGHKLDRDRLVDVECPAR